MVFNFKTQLERTRREKIAHQDALLDTLLHSSASTSSLRGAQQSNRKLAARKSKKRNLVLAHEDSSYLPRRRSTRLRATPGSAACAPLNGVGGDPPEYESSAPTSPPPLREEDFDASSVYQYFVNSKNGPQSVDDGTGEHCPRQPALKGLRLGSIHSSGACSTVYTLHFDPNSSGLLAAGGKGGVVALLDVQEKGVATTSVFPSSTASESSGSISNQPLMCFKAHGGWVSAVQLLSRPKKLPLLITSGNDGLVKLWDIGVERNGCPRLLCSSQHQHAKGIFAMHVHEQWAATGGKDKRVGLSQVADGGLVPDRVLGGHSGIVKDVRFRDSHVLLSCSDDADTSVILHDLRTSTNKEHSVPLLSICRAHERSTHTIRWHPTREPYFMTAGLDGCIRLWDMRKPSACAQSFQGHNHPAVKKERAIRRPEFYEGGSLILSGGEQSLNLSMYDTFAGSTVSRGVLEHEVMSLAISPQGYGDGRGGVVAAALPRGQIALLLPGGI